MVIYANSNDVHTSRARIMNMIIKILKIYTHNNYLIISVRGKNYKKNQVIKKLKRFILMYMLSL